MKILDFYKCLLIICLFLSGYPSRAIATDQQKVDSFLRAANNEKDAAKRSVMLSGASTLIYSIDPNKGMLYAREALALARQAGSETSEEAALNCIGISFEALSLYDSSLLYYSRALSLCEKSHNRSKQQIVLGNITNAYFYQGNFAKAIEIGKRSLRIAEELQDDTAKSLVLGNIGIVYQSMGLLDKAIEYDFEAMKICEYLHDSSGIAAEGMNIGNIFYEQKNYNKALEYYTNSLRISERTGNRKNLAAGFANLGLIYAVKQNFAGALDYQQKALAIHEALGDKNNVANDFLNIGELYGKMGDHMKSLAFFEKANKIMEELGSEQGVAMSMGNIGEAYFNLAKTKNDKQTEYLNLAEQYLKKGISAAFATKGIQAVAGFYQSLAQVLELKGDYKGSVTSWREYVKWNDSIFSQKNRERIAGLEKEREMALTEKELEIKDLALAKKNRNLVIVALMAVILSTTVVWIWQNLKTVKKSNLILTREKRQNIEQIKQQNKVLLDIAYTQSHNVRGPVSTIMGLVELYNHDDPADPTNKELVEGITSVTKKLDTIVTGMVSQVNTLGKDEWQIRNRT